ncbi:hypothetical protein ART_4031 [Arthrobacter sp. PAMC 25486]|uniref:helix-turn-helix domain-containing protein n=1 Tax=Arthrobacter sp. PAMC 25486 TaxID=1494608 RepID=UPI000535E828|nr:AraC family transcriptional regulator [Arthrobacter sp. PAMC 25486]AIY03630.1 hypothetical protein ART_4031 [Arthrobacter sp. PAMC 25486]
MRLGRDQRCNVAGIDFGETAVFAMHLSKGETRIAGLNELADSFSLVFIVDGELDLVSGSSDRPVRAERGDIWTFSRASCFDLAVTAEAQLVAVTLPVQVLQEFGIDEVHNLTALDPNSTLLSPALGFLREIAVQDVEVPSVAAYFMEKLVHEMVGGIMLENRGARFTSSSRKGFFDQAMDYIAATAGDSSLTPATLADELSLSLRQLQREFKRNDTSIAAVILQRRIDLAVRLLKDPKLEVLPLENIAEHSGFTSTVHLRRALREAQAGNPTEIRASAGQQRRIKQPSRLARTDPTTQ